MTACAVACTGYRPARFASRPLVTSLSDNRPISLPSFQDYSEIESVNEAHLRRPLVGALRASRPPPAGDVNAADEVPRSTWFSPVPLDDLPDGYEIDGAPFRPLLVELGETRTASGGLRVVDARGLRYELHRDPKGLPATKTAANAIASRLVRALGYRTPEVWIEHVRRDDLFGGRPHGEALSGIIDRFLSEGPFPDGDGRYRVSATRFPTGVDVGQVAAFGTRGDDPNDVIPHEDRRTVRALRVVSAFLDLSGLGPRNTRDVYVGPAEEGHLQHYVTGLDWALGAAHLSGVRSEVAPVRVRGGFLHNLVTLGLVPDRETRLAKRLADLDGRLDMVEFDAPYEPSARLLPDDAYWIAKRIFDVPDSVLRWATEQGKLPTRADEDAVFTALASRKRRAASWGYRKVTPLEPERLELLRAELVLRDRAIADGFSSPGQARYSIRYLDDAGKRLTEYAYTSPVGSEVRVPLLEALLATTDYLVVQVRSRHGEVVAPRAFEAHVAPEALAFRVVGLRH